MLALDAFVSLKRNVFWGPPLAAFLVAIQMDLIVCVSRPFPLSVSLPGLVLLFPQPKEQTEGGTMASRHRECTKKRTSNRLLFLFLAPRC